jgi:hypothetical protein
MFRITNFGTGISGKQMLYEKDKPIFKENY